MIIVKDILNITFKISDAHNKYNMLYSIIILLCTVCPKKKCTLYFKFLYFSVSVFVEYETKLLDPKFP